MIGTGLVLGSLAGLELSAREHFAGYRSHTLLLAGAVGMLVFGGLFVGVSALHPAICAAAGRWPSGLRLVFRVCVPPPLWRCLYKIRPSQLRLRGPDENPLLPRGQGAEPFRSLSPALASSLREQARPQRRWLQSSSLRLML